jgi:hypothetical protein
LPFEISGMLYFTSNLYVEQDIRPDIWYPAFRLAGYPAGRISGRTDIRPNQYPVYPYLRDCFRFLRYRYVKTMYCTVHCKVYTDAEFLEGGFVNNKGRFLGQ